MNRILTTLLIFIIAPLAVLGADLTSVWEELSSDKMFMTADFDSEKAASNGFESLWVAVDSDPTTDDFKHVRRVTGTIDQNQKITNINQQGIDVSVFAAPASADMKYIKVLLVFEKEDSEVKSLILIYGTCQADKMGSVFQNLSIEDLIPG